MVQIQSDILPSTSVHFRWYSLIMVYIVDSSLYNFDSTTDFIHFSVLPGRLSTQIKLLNEKIEDLPDIIKVDRFNTGYIDISLKVAEHLKVELKKKGHETEIENIHILKIKLMEAILKVDEEIIN